MKLVIKLRMDYYINIMLENLDWGTLNIPFISMEEITSIHDIDEM